MTAVDWDAAKKAVLCVGDGRGFVVKNLGAVRAGYRWRRVVITAAHCLPQMPPAHAAAYEQERTYKALLGPLGQAPTVWAECLFADPVGDIAVLGEPDDQVFAEQYLAYEALIKASGVLRIADAPQRAPARLLSLDGEWFDCKVQHNDGPLWVTDATQGIRGGMSGSPILADNGAVIGVVSVSSGIGEVHTKGGPNPRLAFNLPARFLPTRISERGR